jgi:hypothetical protein
MLITMLNNMIIMKNFINIINNIYIYIFITQINIQIFIIKINKLIYKIH